MNTLFKVIALSTSLALTSGIEIKAEAGVNPFAVTSDVLTTLDAIEKANSGKIDKVCYK